MIWTCPSCKRKYPDEGLPITCKCKKGGGYKPGAPLGDTTPWPPFQECIHQGELLGKLDCKCSTTYPVYECKIHQICTKRHTVHQWIDFEGNTFPPPKGCSLCQEKQFGPDKPA